VLVGNFARGSFAYIFGLLESTDFDIAFGERFIRYNYMEIPTVTISAIV
jgi:hypothetical protein